MEGHAAIEEVSAKKKMKKKNIYTLVQGWQIYNQNNSHVQTSHVQASTFPIEKLQKVKLMQKGKLYVTDYRLFLLILAQNVVVCIWPFQHKNAEIPHPKVFWFSSYYQGQKYSLNVGSTRT